MIDKTLQLIGRELYLGMFLTDFLPKQEWEFISAKIYGMKLVEYSEAVPFNFYMLENLDDNVYEVKYEERYQDRPEADVWLELRQELSDVFNSSQYAYHLLEVLNKY